MSLPVDQSVTPVESKGTGKRQKPPRRKSKREIQKEDLLRNEGAAYLILAQPKRYEGALLVWAWAWQSKHGVPKPKADGFMNRTNEVDPTSLQGKYIARERSRLNKARRKWMTAEWKISRSGNPYLTVGDIRATIWHVKDGFRFLVVNTNTQDECRERGTHPDIDSAKSAAFEAAVYLRGKSRCADPRMKVAVRSLEPHQAQCTGAQGVKEA